MELDLNPVTAAASPPGSFDGECNACGTHESCDKPYYYTPDNSDLIWNAAKPPTPETNAGTSGALRISPVGRKHSEWRRGTSQ
jgi:hypothetical protein